MHSLSRHAHPSLSFFPLLFSSLCRPLSVPHPFLPSLLLLFPFLPSCTTPSLTSSLSIPSNGQTKNPIPALPSLSPLLSSSSLASHSFIHSFLHSIHTHDHPPLLFIRNPPSLLIPLVSFLPHSCPHPSFLPFYPPPSLQPLHSKRAPLSCPPWSQ